MESRTFPPMKPPLLLCLVALAFPVLIHAGEPVYNIPPSAKAPFKVLTLSGNKGPEDARTTLAISYDHDALTVVIKGIQPSELPGDEKVTNPDKWGSAEVFFGAKKGSGNYYKAILRTDVKSPEIVIKDSRDPAPAGPLKAAADSQKEGSEITFTLPFKDLGISPKTGDEISLQVYMNWFDAAGRRHTVSWHPEYRDHGDAAAMYSLRLAEKASPDVTMAARASLDQGQPRVDVYSTTAGPLKVKAGEKVVATGASEKSAGGAAHAVFLVPQSATEVVNDKAESAFVDCTILPDLVSAGLLNIRPMFKQSVFSGEKFPVCDIEKPDEAEKALGKCKLTPEFYDADYNEVKSAAKPGRYGAIIHVETASGQKFNRYATLYRAPGELLGRTLHPEFTDVKLPPELGIDPAVVSSHLRSLGDLFGDQLRISAGISRGPEAAIMLAWLSETKADATPDLHRTGPSEADQKWWYGLKKKTGNLRTDYFVHLPPGYDNDPQKKWPVILFLHGSGERGYDLKLLARQPLVQGIGKRKDFPFILIAPQVSPGEWWSIPELDDLLDSLPSKYRIDTDRIYLTGLSMGGFATWSYLAAEPERFAAAAPICGGGDPADAARFKDVPIWVFHGEADDAVPIQRSQEMVDALKKLGSDVQYTTYPGVDHFSWIPTYKNPELFKWLLEQKRSQR